MERATDYQSHEEPVRYENQPERMRCLNCKQMVLKNAICSLCGYPLQIGIPEHPEPENASKSGHMVAATQQDSEDSNGPLLEARPQHDAEASEPTEQGELNHSVSKEDVSNQAETGSEPGDSTSFLDELTKYAGEKRKPQTKDTEKQAENDSHWFEEMKQRRAIGGASATGSKKADAG